MSKFPIQVICTDAIEKAAIRIGAAENSKNLVRGQLVTITKIDSRHAATNLVGTDNQKIFKVYFGIAECCEGCRAGQLHHWVYGKIFDELFESVEDNVKEKKKADVLIPVKDLIYYVNALYSVMCPENGGTTYKKVYTGRYAYSTLFANNGTCLFIDCGKNYSAKSLAENELIPEGMAAPLLALYKTHEARIKRIAEIRNLISQNYDVISKGEKSE